ncbi:MAG TPA: glycosyltransferase family A protein [Terrimicrobiaceae bacterium]|nr:glycosyltransferase family A protein [Terrimicrobiaceae bacterium]
MKASLAFWKKASEIYDATLCSPAGVRRQAARRPAPFAGEKISVAIPHHNRGRLIHRPLRNLLSDGRISEILIVDDASDPGEYEALLANVRELDRGRKVRVIRHEENLGAMGNKLECVKHASTEWLILLDSDNTIFQNYLDAVYRLPAWDPGVLYCPGWAFPYFSFKPLIGEHLDFARCAELCRDATLRKIYIINDGNYFLNRAAYLENLGRLAALRHDVADVMVANYLWLSNGLRLEVLRNAHYFHRIDASSFWMRTQEESRKRVFRIFERFEKDERWEDSLLQEFNGPGR